MEGLEEINIEKTTKNVFVGEMEGKRLRVRPRLRWIDSFNFNNHMIPIFHVNLLFILNYKEG